MVGVDATASFRRGGTILPLGGSGNGGSPSAASPVGGPGLAPSPPADVDACAALAISLAGITSPSRSSATGWLGGVVASALGAGWALRRGTLRSRTVGFGGGGHLGVE